MQLCLRFIHSFLLTAESVCVSSLVISRHVGIKVHPAAKYFNVNYCTVYSLFCLQGCCMLQLNLRSGFCNVFPRCNEYISIFPSMCSSVYLDPVRLVLCLLLISCAEDYHFVFGTAEFRVHVHTNTGKVNKRASSIVKCPQSHACGNMTLCCVLVYLLENN